LRIVILSNCGIALANFTPARSEGEFGAVDVQLQHLNEDGFRMNLRLARKEALVELRLIAESGWRRFPPRPPEQPIFYPVENEEYARQIARDWNVKSDGEGHVIRFLVDAAFIARYPIQQAGNRLHVERWIPAEDLEELNDEIVGKIEVIASYP
jgi:hypothetical protein